ncbi:MAG: hypothetical protein EXS09_04965 [Gemmataceae bacterium]|nr:hypothetical protein [Gemmataceae bacterium]
MPTIISPKCQGKLRFPEDSPARRVKCPTCGSVFMSSDGATATGTSGSKEVLKARDSKDFELPTDDDRKRRPGRRDEDADDRDRGSRRGNRDDDDDRGRRGRYDDDDRPRQRRDEDNDDDNRRSRRDEDDYDRPRRKKNDWRALEGQMNRASMACLLNFIGGWLQVAALGIMAFVWFLHWCGVQEGLRVFTIIAGLLGLGYWLTSATGIGFLVSGPRNRGALGLSIGTASVAGLHLMIMIVLATSRTIGELSPDTARSTDVSWAAFVSQLQALPGLLFLEIGLDIPRERAADGNFLPVFTNLLEIARMVLFLLTLRAIMLCAKETRAASTCMKTMIGYAGGAGGLLLVGILFGLLLLGMKPTGKGQAANIDSLSAIVHLFMLVLFLVPAGLAVGTTLIVKSVKGRIDYRR